MEFSHCSSVDSSSILLTSVRNEEEEKRKREEKVKEAEKVPVKKPEPEYSSMRNGGESEQKVIVTGKAWRKKPSCRRMFLIAARLSRHLL
ncbi:hypothetical protein F2Q68_00031071 [Brassica cretica]|uniref:Uncharacterized protein n=1 Tax=Brassica cretica TaxID=69181 RepID=A0A8S9GDS7_BRACR|nr:hypothetical protein F2Q68_00031071 [Brassica cretica]